MCAYTCKLKYKHIHKCMYARPYTQIKHEQSLLFTKISINISTVLKYSKRNAYLRHSKFKILSTVFSQAFNITISYSPVQRCLNIFFLFHLQNFLFWSCSLLACLDIEDEVLTAESIRCPGSPQSCDALLIFVYHTCRRFHAFTLFCKLILQPFNFQLKF